jgi:hypothetical protein
MEECQLPKLEVAGSTPVIRSKENNMLLACLGWSTRFHTLESQIRSGYRKTRRSLRQQAAMVTQG